VVALAANTNSFGTFLRIEYRHENRYATWIVTCVLRLVHSMKHDLYQKWQLLKNVIDAMTPVILKSFACTVYIYIYICVDTHTCTHSKHYILKICIHVMDVMFNYIHTECWPGWPLLLNWWAIKQPQNKTKLNDLGISLEASKFETSKTTCNFRILECTTDTSQQNSCTITVQDTRGTDAETVHICFFAAQLNDITL